MSAASARNQPSSTGFHFGGVDNLRKGSALNAIQIAESLITASFSSARHRGKRHISPSMSHSPIERYRARLKAGQLQPDKAQARAAQALETLYRALKTYRPKSRGISVLVLAVTTRSLPKASTSMAMSDAASLR